MVELKVAMLGHLLVVVMVVMLVGLKVETKDALQAA
jgi:hypothetical protein